MMRTYRGVVFEKRKKYTVFLTEEGEFVRGIPTSRSPEIGEEADFEKMDANQRLSGKMKPKLVGALMMAAVLFFVILTSFIPANEQVMAYVQLETNDAVELGVNRAGKVIEIRYLNEESKEKEARLDNWKGESISEVLDKAVKSVESQNKEVNVTIIYENTKKQEKVQKVVEGAVQKVQNSNKALAIEIEKSSMKERGKANQHRMSVHKFKESQKVPPKNEMEPSSKVENTPAKEQSNRHESVEKENPIMPPKKNKENAIYNNNGNNNGKGQREPKDLKANQGNSKPTSEQGEKNKNTSAENENINGPKQGNRNPNKGNLNNEHSNKGNPNPSSNPSNKGQTPPGHAKNE